MTELGVAPFPEVLISLKNNVLENITESQICPTHVVKAYGGVDV